MDIYLIPIAIVLLVVQLAVIALVIWIGYRLVVAAVRTGILEADAERARRAASTPPTSPGWHLVDGGKRYWDGTRWTTETIPSA